MVKHKYINTYIILSLVLIAMLIISGVFAPFIVPHSPIDIDLSKSLKPPSREYIMGTDNLGRCVFSRIIYGIRVSLGTSFIVMVIVVIIGVSIGTFSGFIGGKVDDLIMRAIDILMAFPSLILALVIAGTLGPSIFNMMIALSLVQWVGYARITRGMVISVKERDYIRFAKACGTSNLNIILRHILPNIIGPISVFILCDAASTILRISTLSFLGIGAQPPTPEWGSMLNDGVAYMKKAPWIMFFPGAAIFTTVVAFNLLGDGLQE